MAHSPVPLPGGLAQLIVPRSGDLGGGFTVRRVLPSRERRLVGPFIFFDQMGPTRLAPGQGLDVLPHPHIGLATVTYLFRGQLLHRDSLGSVQGIEPGAVSWMTAGRGIVHSERTPPPVRPGGGELYGIQSWVALPGAAEECAPAFAHHAATALPELEADGVRIRVIAGHCFGAHAPVAVASELFYADIELAAGARLEIPADHEERALYPVEGRLEVGGQAFEPLQLLVLAPGQAVTVAAVDGPVRLMALGGAALEGPRHIYWNFVSSSRERIEQAKQDWRDGRFAPVPGESEVIPLPEQPAPVKYP